MALKYTAEHQKNYMYENLTCTMKNNKYTTGPDWGLEAKEVGMQMWLP